MVAESLVDEECSLVVVQEGHFIVWILSDTAVRPRLSGGVEAGRSDFVPYVGRDGRR